MGQGTFVCIAFTGNNDMNTNIPECKHSSELGSGCQNLCMNVCQLILWNISDPNWYGFKFLALQQSPRDTIG